MRMRVLAVSALSLFLTGCFGGGTSDTTVVLVPNSKLFEVDEFTIEYPRDWRVLTSKDFPSNVPKTTKVVFQNNVKGDFIDNLSIGVLDNPDSLSSMDYTKLALQSQRNALLNMKDVNSEEYYFLDGQSDNNSMIVEFTAKETDQGQERYFVQAFLTKNDKAYVLTGASAVEGNENVLQLFKGMIKSFTLK